MDKHILLTAMNPTTMRCAPKRMTRNEIIESMFPPRIQGLLKNSGFTLFLSEDRRIWAIRTTDPDELYENIATSVSGRWSAMTSVDYTIIRFSNDRDELWFKLRYGDEQISHHPVMDRYSAQFSIRSLKRHINADDVEEIFNQIREEYFIAENNNVSFYLGDYDITITVGCLHDLHVLFCKFVEPYCEFKNYT